MATNYTTGLSAVVGPAPKVSLKGKKKTAPANNYKIPKTPKVSGMKWGM